MASTAVLIWYLAIAGPTGGLMVLPGSFDTREQCAAAITEYQKQAAPGWLLQCVPNPSPFAANGSGH
ncbi:hypothetical protein EOA30_12260 [Mesorhizobium sp. M8A.F.Ca.ET.059.01.1.1]|nr:hypothetical protein EOA30_12260 [Mesorhizobium sp. M8A.F.Ca.ET.059.01.1.1]